MPGSVWETVLERAYQNGWRPAGTGAPWEQGGRTARIPTIEDTQAEKSGRWPKFDYFSASSQRVHPADALALGVAVMRGVTPRTKESDPADRRAEAGLSRIASFARIGGFVIGRAPARDQAAEPDRP